MVKKEAALEKVPLFSRLNKRFVKGLAEICSERVFKPGDALMKQGEEGIGLFIIVSGTVKVVKTGPDGATVEIAQNGPGDVMGELAVIDGYARTASVIAVEKTTCLCLASWEFNAFIKAHPEVAMEILPVVVKRFRETNASLMALRETKKDGGKKS
jgi:CRP/FNR family transcriptional regulator, cyclic AMP receptor protein